MSSVVFLVLGVLKFCWCVCDSSVVWFGDECFRDVFGRVLLMRVLGWFVDGAGLDL
jgi:hypothetical protein